jgi:putative membrane protein
MKTTLAKTCYVAGITTFCTFLGCWAVLAHQSSAAQDAAPTHKSTTMSDSHFAKKAAQGGMAEVKMGQLAADKGTNDAVKAFGKRMVDDHTKAGDELKDAASKENITLPDDVDAKDKTAYDSLSKLSGAAFDRAYAHHMVRDHEEDIAEFKKEANDGKDGAIKSFASQTLPTLEDHLKQAREMMQAVSSKSKESASSER